MFFNKVSDLNEEKNNVTENALKTKEKKGFSDNISHFKGILLALLTALSYSFSNIFFKKANYLTCTEQLSINFLLRAISMLVVILYNKNNFLGPKGSRCLLSVRGIFGVLALILFYCGLQFIPPSDATALGHTSIIVTAVLSKIFFKEKLSIVHLISFLFTTFGVLSISKPTFLFDSHNFHNSNFSCKNNLSLISLTLVSNSDNLNYYKFIIGLIFVISSAFFFGSLQIIIKKLFILKVPNSINTIYVSYYGLPITILLSILLRLKIGYNFGSNLNNLLIDIFYSSLSGIFCVLGQVALNYSLVYEDATIVSIAKTSDVLIQFVLQLLILHVKADLFSIIGCFSIILSTLIILVYKLLIKNSNQ